MTAVMTWGRLALLCLFYVAADFGNPLMPGAVSLADGFVEGVREGRDTRFGAPARRAAEPVAPRADVVPTVPPPRSPRRSAA